MKVEKKEKEAMDKIVLSPEQLADLKRFKAELAENSRIYKATLGDRCVIDLPAHIEKDLDRLQAESKELKRKIQRLEYTPIEEFKAGIERHYENAAVETLDKLYGEAMSYSNATDTSSFTHSKMVSREFRSANGKKIRVRNNMVFTEVI